MCQPRSRVCSCSGFLPARTASIASAANALSPCWNCPQYCTTLFASITTVVVVILAPKRSARSPAESISTGIFRFFSLRTLEIVRACSPALASNARMATFPSYFWESSLSGLSTIRQLPQNEHQNVSTVTPLVLFLLSDWMSLSVVFLPFRVRTSKLGTLSPTECTFTSASFAKDIKLVMKIVIQAITLVIVFSIDEGSHTVCWIMICIYCSEISEYFQSKSGIPRVRNYYQRLEHLFYIK